MTRPDDVLKALTLCAMSRPESTGMIQHYIAKLEARVAFLEGVLCREPTICVDPDSLILS